MEIISAVIQNTDTPEIQGILAKLDSDRDNLFTNINPDDENCIEVQYIEPINNIKTVGTIPDEIISDIREKYGNDVTIEIADYMITYESGVYGIVADIEVNDVKAEDKPRRKRLPLPVLIIVGAATCVLTAVLVIIKLIAAARKKK